MDIVGSVSITGLWGIEASVLLITILVTKVVSVVVSTDVIVTHVVTISVLTLD